MHLYAIYTNCIFVSAGYLCVEQSPFEMYFVLLSFVFIARRVLGSRRALTSIYIYSYIWSIPQYLNTIPYENCDNLADYLSLQRAARARILESSMPTTQQHMSLLKFLAIVSTSSLGSGRLRCGFDIMMIFYDDWINIDAILTGHKAKQTLKRFLLAASDNKHTIGVLPALISHYNHINERQGGGRCI